MEHEIYGRRPDMDAKCGRCKADGTDASPFQGKTTAYYRAPERVKGQKAHPAVWVHWCPFHMEEVTPI
jgi:hypothetical protein